MPTLLYPQAEGRGNDLASKRSEAQPKTLLVFCRLKDPCWIRIIAVCRSVYDRRADLIRLSRAAPRFCRVFDGSEFTTIKMTDLKFTYCFCAHMHEIVKYFILTESEIQEQCLNPMPERARLIGPGRPAESSWSPK